MDIHVDRPITTALGFIQCLKVKTTSTNTSTTAKTSSTNGSPEDEIDIAFIVEYSCGHRSTHEQSNTHMQTEVY